MDRAGSQTPVWKFSARAQALSGSAIRDIVKKIGQRPDVISFAGGLPSPATFPIDAIRSAFDAVLTRERCDLLVTVATAPAALIRRGTPDPVFGPDGPGGATYGVAAVAGYPSVTVPMGDIAGLPYGILF